MSMHMTPSDEGCGCGGTGGCGCGGGGECGCGGAGGREVCTDLNFKRPRFFAGQLLTEDDLQALTDYVVGKNRLHNRFLFGDGVVCGLSVTCDPCEDGHVAVAPGYALDCCGNDIMVPCKEDLDIKALLRDLRKRQLAGYDCGDPCDKKDGDIQTYGLYVTYTETLEDPVAPYASGDPCGQQGCEPTRVCEGYKFELRCECSTTERPDVWKRIRACLGDLRQAGAAVQKAQAAQVQAERVIQAVDIAKADLAIPFERQSFDLIVETPNELAKLNALEVADDGEIAAKDLPDERGLRLDIARVQLLTGAVTRRNLAGELALDIDDDEVASALAAARKAASDAVDRIEILGPRILTTPAAKTEAEETVRIARRFLAEDISEERLNTVEARMVALNTPVSFAQVSRMQIDAALLKDWLLDRLGNGLNRTRCDLYERLRRIRIERPGNAVSSDLSESGATAAAVIELLKILLEYLIDCICLALNPPCQPCEDKGVLLACLKVRDCEVVEICNMSRRHVLSPVAMRYWLPPISAIGKLIEKFCCEFDVDKLFRRRPKPEPIEPGGQFIQSGDFNVAVAAAQPIVAGFAPIFSATEIDADTALVLERFALTPADVQNVATLTSNLSLLAGRTVLDGARGSSLGAFLQDRLPGLANRFGGANDVQFRSRNAAAGDASRVAVDAGDIEERLKDRISETSVALKAELGEQLDAEVSSVLDQRLEDEIPSMVTKELTAARIRRAVSDAKAVKDLKADNKRLSDELAALTAVVEELKAGGTS